MIEEGVAPTSPAADASPTSDAAPSRSRASAGGAGPSAGGIWRNRDFRVVLIGQGISALGDAVSFTALPLLVLFLTGSGVAMGIVGVLQTLPDLIFGLPAGALADRHDRRRMMLYADLGRAALTALIPLAFALGWNTMAVILIVTAPINLLRVIFLAGWTAAIPTLVGREHVGKANGYSEAIFSLSFILGPAIAGVLAAVIGPATTMAIDALSFAVSALGLSLVRRKLQSPRTGEQKHVVHEIAEGIHFIWREPALRIVIGFWSAVSVVTAPLVPAVIFYLRIDRARSPAVVGLVLSAYGAGYLIGAILAGRASKGRLGSIIVTANLASYLLLVPFAMSDVEGVWLVAAFGVGVAGALVLISYITLRATIPPDALLGRVGSTARTLSLGLQPIGLLIGGALLDAVGGRVTMLAIGAAAAAVTMLFALSPTLRGARARA